MVAAGLLQPPRSTEDHRSDLFEIGSSGGLRRNPTFDGSYGKRWRPQREPGAFGRGQCSVRFVSPRN